MSKFYLTRKWRWPKVCIALMIIELAGTVATLSLFGIASPNAYRTILWQIGSDNGFNSSPDQILYAYANYWPIPVTPLVWSSTITEFNIVVSVFSMFMLLLKATLWVLHMWVPIGAMFANIALTAMWAYSAYGQAGPDYSDPKHPSSVAWYIVKSCDYAAPSGNAHNCQMAKGSFASTIVMLALFVCSLALSIWSLFPTAAERLARKTEVDELQESPSSAHSQEKEWEMKNFQRPVSTAQQPFTPRTLAFHTLDRQLPLRSDRFK